MSFENEKTPQNLIFIAMIFTQNFFYPIVVADCI